MLTARIILSFRDGQTATAELQAESAEQNYPVRYSGDLARIADAPKSSDLAFLAFSLKAIAQATGAAYAEEIIGQYDRHAV